MKKREPVIEWDVLEDDQEWRTVQASLPESVTTRQMVTAKVLHNERRLAAVVVVFLLLLAGSWVWYRQVKQATVVNELQVAIAGEGTRSLGGEGTSVRLPSSQTMPIAGPEVQFNHQASSSTQAFSDNEQPELKINSYSQWGDQVMAQISIGYLSTQGEELVYRETRFYRQAAGEWLRIDPVPDLLGPWQRLETEHFTFRYQPVDAKTIAEAAPKLEWLYGAIRSDFGLPLVGPRPKITIEVADAYAPVVERITTSEARTSTIKLPSPTLLQIPIELSDASVFEQAALFSLASLVVQEVTEQNPNLWLPGVFSRQPVFNALRLWELRDHGGPLASAQAEVVRWIYRNSNNSQGHSYRSLPEHYESLCRLYRVWNLSPSDFAMPLDCTALDQNLKVYPSFPLQLTKDFSFVQLMGTVPSGDLFVRTVALETVIAYIVKTYGRAQLPALVQAFGKYEDWKSLIPALFGISVEEFEQGWQKYLADEYQ